MQFRWTRKPSILELISVHQLVKITTKLHRHTVPSLKQVLYLNHLFLAWLVVTSRLTCLKHPHCEYSMDEETGLEGILSPVHSRPSYNTIGQKKLGELNTEICEIWRNYFSHNPNTEFSIDHTDMLKTSFRG